MGVIGIRVVSKGLFAVQFEDVRGERNALRVSLTPIQIHDNPHLSTPYSLTESLLALIGALLGVSFNRLPRKLPRAVRTATRIHVKSSPA